MTLFRQVLLFALSNMVGLTWASVPNQTTFGIISTPNDAVHLAVVQETLRKINNDATILPKTKIKSVNVSLSVNNALTNIMKLMDEETTALFEVSFPQVPSDIAADMLNSTLTTTNLFDCDQLLQVEDYAICDHAISLYQDLSTMNKAVVGVLSAANISEAIIIYDVMLSKQVTNFLDLSKGILKKQELVYLNFGTDSELSAHAMQDLRGIRSMKITTVIMFVDQGNMELIMDIVNLYCTCNAEVESILWILPKVNSTDYNANPTDRVIGLKLQQNNGKEYRELLEHVRHSSDYTGHALPESAVLLHDAIYLLANATQHVISSGQWELAKSQISNHLFPNRSQNAGKIRRALTKVSFNGFSGFISINEKGQRIDPLLEILNLRKDKFYKIGLYTASTGATLTGKIEQNRRLPTTPIAHKTLQVVAMKQKPFVFIDKNGQNGNISGYSFDLLTKLSQQLKFKIVIREVRNISEMINELVNERADIALNPIVVSADRQKVLSFTKPFMHFSVGLLVKKKEEKDLDLTQFMLPFTIPAWCLLLSSCIVVTFIVYLLDKHSPYGWRQTQIDQGEDGDEFNLFNSFWFCMACMLTQGADNTPRNLSGRILAGCFWFCVLIWNATYTANLASFLVLKTSALPVTSLSQAVSMDYNMIMIRNSAIAKVVEKSKNTLYQEIWQKVQRKNTFDDTHEEAVSRIRNAGKSAFIAEEPFLNYYKGRLKCNLVMVSNVLQPMSFAFGLPLTSKYTHAMSLGILRLQEQGVTDSYERKWWEYQNQCPKETNAVSQSRLDVKEMLGVYLVLSAGIVIAVLVVGVEIWWKKSLGKTMKTFFAAKKRNFSSKIEDQKTTNVALN